MNGKPDLNGLWQAMNSANYDIQAHTAKAALQMRPGPVVPVPAKEILAMGAVGSVPSGAGVVEGTLMPRSQVLTAGLNRFAVDVDHYGALDRPVTKDLAERSTLAPANRAAEAEMGTTSDQRRTPQYAALFDPQTSGGLLLAVAEQHASALLARLAQQSDLPAAVIGRVVPATRDGIGIRVR